MVKVMKCKVGSAARKLVLLKLADNANDNAECWPSYKHIADHCEINRRSVMRHINQLALDGFLTKQYRKGIKGNTSNKYRITIPSDNLSPLPIQVVTPCHQPSDTVSPTLVTQCHPEPVTLEPVIEPIYSFENFWLLYDKKNDVEACRKKFNKLKASDLEMIFATLPSYIQSTPDKKYRKNPSSYINKKAWKDEIITTNQPNSNSQKLSVIESTNQATDDWANRQRHINSSTVLEGNG